MSILECAFAIQATATESQSSNTPTTGYIVLGLAAVVLGLVVVVFIRARTKGSPKE